MIRQEINKKIRVSLAFLFGVGFALMPVLVSAAEIRLDSNTQSIGVGSQFEVNVFINTDNEAINAIEGKITFPQDLLEIKKINDGNSIINFWIDPVKNCVANGVEKPNEICFSGIIPGGYNDSRGLIFSITFLAKKEGSGAIEFNGVRALKNDGNGTGAPLTISNFQFLISNPPAGGPVSQITVPETEDSNPPEEFTPQIAADPAIFEGKWFLVFATQDKGSGIDHYEVCETKRKTICETDAKWTEAESPYLLKDQKLRSYIYVKAVDKAGNTRIVFLAPRYSLKWYENWVILVIIILGIIIVSLARKFYGRNKSQN